jgi:mannose-6-phosphate isomerase-like protein (cupin superfamily)
MSTRETGPFDLSKSPIHLGSRVGVDNPAVALHGFGFNGPAFEAYMAEHCAPDAPGRLVMIETSPIDWPAWECHTEGDELVIVLEGQADFIQEIDGVARQMAVSAGCAVINPAGVWHTANVKQPLRAIYITPCPGTQHRPR